MERQVKNPENLETMSIDNTVNGYPVLKDRLDTFNTNLVAVEDILRANDRKIKAQTYLLYFMGVWVLIFMGLVIYLSV